MLLVIVLEKQIVSQEGRVGRPYGLTERLAVNGPRALTTVLRCLVVTPPRRVPCKLMQ
jgi:hypothetical protein